MRKLVCNRNLTEAISKKIKIPVTHMKFRKFRRNFSYFGDFRKLGQYDLLYTYGTIA